MKKLLVGLIVLAALLIVPMAASAAEASNSTTISGSVNDTIELDIADSTLGWPDGMSIGANIDSTTLTVRSTSDYGVTIKDSRSGFSGNCTQDDGCMCAGSGTTAEELLNPIDITCSGATLGSTGLWGPPQCAMTTPTVITTGGTQSFFTGYPDKNAYVTVNVNQDVEWGDTLERGAYSISIMFTATTA